MRIGYSFWGFLGPGITDTPDGGRSHRRTLVDGLRGLGHEIIFLQPNRDLHEAGHDLRDRYVWDTGLPDIDVLFLEWRWRIPGRNDTPCTMSGHTCDLHRQEQLVRHYALRRLTPVILWDKDRQLPAGDGLRALSNVTVCEPALHPSPGAVSLLFPVADTALDAADPERLAAAVRDIPLIYIGNQYDRDAAFEAFFAPAAAAVPHLVAGHWPHTARWPHVTFTGRIPFPEVERLYARSLTTVLLAPDRYATRGQFTQRIFEAVLAGCLPLAPAYLRSAGLLLPPELIVTDGAEVTATINRLGRIAGTPAHTDLLRCCLRHLDVFRLSRQLAVLTRLLNAARQPRRPGGKNA